MKPVSADTGLGTTYERWALNRCLVRLQAELGWRTVLEGPGDGMTGIAGLNSLALGLAGAQVTLLLPDAEQARLACDVWARVGRGVETQDFASLHHRLQVRGDAWDGKRLAFPANTFDLTWNFNVMTRHPDPQALLAELSRVSRKWVLVFVPNRQNYAFPLHRLHHWVADEPWDHGDPALMHPAPWKNMFADLGLRPQRILWVDCPWWPDIVDLGQLLADFFPLLKRPPFDRLAQRAKPENRYRWPADGLPYYHPERFPEVHAQMERLAFFENTRHLGLKQRFAHHVGILAVKNTPAAKE